MYFFTISNLCLTTAKNGVYYTSIIFKNRTENEPFVTVMFNDKIFTEIYVGANVGHTLT